MIELELARLKGEKPEATLQWDEETGDLIGPVAARVIALAAECAKSGSVTTDPYPTTYRIGKEPLRCRRDLALVLSTLWVVPEALRDALPEPPEEDGSNVDLVY